MRFIGLDGRQYNLLVNNLAHPQENVSSYHERARHLIAGLFPFDSRLEEVTLPGTGGLAADFFLPNRRLIIEVHGQQHYEKSNLFHKSQQDFWRGKNRDHSKIHWCEINNFTYIELPWNESDEEWAGRIRAGD